VLHTADWHLGATLGPHSRLPEQAQFLSWLARTVAEEKIDLIIIAGDVFDTANPPKEADRLYYEFLAEVTRSRTVQVLVLAGNHDSVWHLEAPQDLLGALGVRVIGPAGLPEDSAVDYGPAVVLAIPFLRERDYTKPPPGETPAEAQSRAQHDLIRYYRRAITAGKKLAQGRPLLVTGHLTVLGATTSDHERSTLVGTIDAVGADLFAGADYVALGHLHRPQAVAKRPHLRYSGSPLPLSFSEVGDEKSVVVFNLEKNFSLSPRLISVPITRQLYRLHGSYEEVLALLKNIKPESETLPPWFDAQIIAPLASADLVTGLHTAVDATGGSLIKLTIRSDEDSPLAWEKETTANLADFSPTDVFREKLTSIGLDLQSEEAKALIDAFQQVVAEE
jgi:exonuclease SbcD